MTNHFNKDINTDNLLNEIKNSKNISDYFNKNANEMHLCSFAEYLDQWLTKQRITKADVVRLSNLNKAYVYQIFSGKKHPSRDKVIALSFGLKLTLAESQVLLKQAGYRELYPRDPRDTLIIFSLSHSKSILETNDLLFDHNIKVLE
ncbi:MAG: XRE family transcriptional regulator [Eubacteriales bacterium]